MNLKIYLQKVIVCLEIYIPNHLQKMMIKDYFQKEVIMKIYVAFVKDIIIQLLVVHNCNVQIVEQII